jgi:hypothetical protein
VATPTVDFPAILQRLVEHEIDFIVVGGICAVLHGAPVATFDLDLVHSRTSENIRRLLLALESLDARYREPASRGLKPDSSHLSSPGHQLLMTKFGLLDLLGSIGDGHDYDDLCSQVSEMKLTSGLTVRVLNLATLIKTKEETGGEKDRAILPTLRRTLEEKSRT